MPARKKAQWNFCWPLAVKLRRVTLLLVPRISASAVRRQRIQQVSRTALRKTAGSAVCCPATKYRGNHWLPSGSTAHPAARWAVRVTTFTAKRGSSISVTFHSYPCWGELVQVSSESQHSTLWSSLVKRSSRPQAFSRAAIRLRASCTIVGILSFTQSSFL